MNVSTLLRAGHKMSEVANLVGVSRTTIYAIKKRMDDGKGVNIRAGRGRKTVVGGNWELERRLCDELSLNLERSPVSFGKTNAHACYPRQAPLTLPNVC